MIEEIKINDVIYVIKPDTNACDGCAFDNINPCCGGKDLAPVAYCSTKKIIYVKKEVKWVAMMK